MSVAAAEGAMKRSGVDPKDPSKVEGLVMEDLITTYEGKEGGTHDT